MLIVVIIVILIILGIIKYIDTYVYCIIDCQDMSQANCLQDCQPPARPRGKAGEPVTLLDQRYFNEYRSSLKQGNPNQMLLS